MLALGASGRLSLSRRVRQVNREAGKGDRDDERQGTQDPEQGGSPTMGGGSTEGLPVEGTVG